MRALLLSLMAAILMVTPVQAVQPDEILDDPALEARAREISKEVRCLVCRNESIDDSSADLARDLRLLVRERLVAGDSDQGVKDYLVARYGEFVLLRPPLNIGNLALWLAGPLLFLMGLAGSIAYLRGRARAATSADTPLSREEAAEVERLLKG